MVLWLLTHGKAELLWHSFLDRLSVSLLIDDLFDFSQLFTPLDSLSSLSIPFMLEELDSVEAHMLSDKSPGPDGFSSQFLKVCSPVIKFYFYHLYDYFWGGNVILQCINDSFVTLIPQNVQMIFGPYVY
jgi:hypothetical protein